MNTMSHNALCQYDVQPSAATCPCCVPAQVWHHLPYGGTTYHQGQHPQPPQQKIPPRTLAALKAPEWLSPLIAPSVPAFPTEAVARHTDGHPADLVRTVLEAATAAGILPHQALTAELQEEPVAFQRCWVLWRDVWQMVRGKPVLDSYWPVQEIRTLPELYQAFDDNGSHGLELNTSNHLFQHGTEPVYSDPHNSRGGHFTIRVGDAAAADTMWQNIVLDVVTKNVPSVKKITGVSLIRKPKYMCLQLWVTDSRKQGVLEAIREYLLSTLGNGKPMKIKFSPHRYLLDSMGEASAAQLTRRPVAPLTPAPLSLPQQPYPAPPLQAPRATPTAPGNTQPMQIHVAVPSPPLAYVPQHTLPHPPPQQQPPQQKSFQQHQPPASNLQPQPQQQRPAESRPICAFYFKQRQTTPTTSVPLNAFPLLG